MPFVKLDLDNVKEPSAAPEGTYPLRIVKAVDTESKKGNPMTVFTIRIEDAGVQNVAPFNHYMVYPAANDEYREMRLLDIKRFLQLFSIPFEGGGFETQSTVGCTADGFLQQEEGDDGVIRNRLRLPRIKE